LVGPDTIDATLSHYIPDTIPMAFYIRLLLRNMLAWDPTLRYSAADCLDTSLFTLSDLPPLPEGKVTNVTTPQIVEPSHFIGIDKLFDYVRVFAPNMQTRTFFLAVDYFYRYLVDAPTNTNWALLPGACLLLATRYYTDAKGLNWIYFYLQNTGLVDQFTEEDLYAAELLLLKRLDYILYRPWFYDVSKNSQDIQQALPILASPQQYYAINPEEWIST